MFEFVFPEGVCAFEFNPESTYYRYADFENVYHNQITDFGNILIQKKTGGGDDDDPPSGDDGVTNWDFIVPVTHQKTVPAGYVGVSTPEQLNNIRNNLSGDYILTGNIDLSDWGEWEPIGNGINLNTGTGDNPFTGTFDGNGYVIKNMTINIESESIVDAGLFGYNNGVLCNVGIVGGSVATSSTYSLVGSMAGMNEGSISNCYNTANASATGLFVFSNVYNAYVGGITGYNISNISNCYNTGNAYVDFYSTSYAGGITGRNDYNGSISSCSNTGSVSASTSASYSYAGGIAGYNGNNGNGNKSNISSCSNTGSVFSFTSGSHVGSYAGGITGDNDGSIDNSHNDSISLFSSNGGMGGTAGNLGGIAGRNSSSGSINNCYNTTSSVHSAYVASIIVGGIAGSNYGGISNCHNAGSSVIYHEPDASSDDVISGGIAAFNNGNISNCYNSCNISVNSRHKTYVGGIATYNNGNISRCYNTGNIFVSSSYGNTYAGGIAGQNYIDCSISDCYNTGSVFSTSIALYNVSFAFFYSYAGGIVGEASSGGNISNCYNAGSVSSASYYYEGSPDASYSFAGGIAGAGKVNNCYYLNIINKGIGSGLEDDTIVCTAAEMQKENTFVGFDFNAVWAIDPNKNDGYPYLRSLEP